MSIAPSGAAGQPAAGPVMDLQSAEVGGGQVTPAAPPASVTVTVTYGANPGVVRQVLRSVHSSGAGAPVALHQLAPAAQPATAPPPDSGPASPALVPATALAPAAALAAHAADLATRAATLANRAAVLANRAESVISSPQLASALVKRAAALARRASLLAARAAKLSAVPAPLSGSPTPSQQPVPVTPPPAGSPSPLPTSSPASSPSPSLSASSSLSPTASATSPAKTSFLTMPTPGFDTCTAPSVQAMQAWRHSYSSAAIYIGGAEMACGYGNLSASWVRSVRAMGWSLIPIYVGRQAPCNSFSQEIQPSQAATEGTWAAADAVHDAQSLGLGTGSPVYFDMEAYNNGDSTCRDSVLSFINAWDQQLNALHYVSGMYSSAASGIEDMGTATSVYGRTLVKPQSIWFALWDNAANTIGTPYMLSSWWTPDRRIKQYEGGHWVTVDGVRLDIDSDWVEGAVYGG